MGVKPGALTDLLRQVAATPEPREAEPPLLPGTVIGRFEVVREVGRGGFGVVYQARDRELGRLVALKVVRAGAAVDEEGRVVREAEAIARLSHPNLITLHDVGRSDRGPYLVFEFLNGKTLQERLGDGPLPVQEAVHVATEVARGLAHAHAEGVVHRDLKPSNVFLTDRGLVKILDFGLAHAFGRRRVSGGTPAYMAPEQWEDDPEDERTDVFALGVMLYQMLSGEVPFPERDGRWSEGPATAPKIDVPGASGLAELVDRMLEKTPKGRPRDGAAVLAALTPIEKALRARPADGSPQIRATRKKATLGDLLAELKRRRVFRVMVGYGIFAFAVLQVTEPVLHAFDLPGWFLTAVVTSVAVGFPLAVILAWIFDLTAQGVKRTPTGMGAGGRSVPRASLAAFLLGVALLAAIPVVGWYAWKRASERHPIATATAGQPSIAVLPFVDMSPGKDQEYLADGVAEEILGALVRVERLRVVGRTSSFSFKGKNVRLADIGRELRVSTVLEGSVRKDGNRIRVTAQLVNVADESQLWSENYSRELAQVFAVQDEIAKAVVEALKVKLLGSERLPMNLHRTVSTEAYGQYLLGRELFNHATRKAYGEAVLAYEKALALDPGYAPAWAGLAIAVHLTSATTSSAETEHQRRALAAADKAIALSPELADGFAARGYLRTQVEWDWAGAKDDLDRAVALSPGDATSHRRLGILLSSLGQLPAALVELRRAIDLDPLATPSWMTLGNVYSSMGQLDAAQEAFGRALQIFPEQSFAMSGLVTTHLLQGRPSEALALAERNSDEAFRLTGVALAQQDLGHTRESQTALDALAARFAHDSATEVAEVYAWRGETDRALEWLERAYAQRDVDLAGIKTDPLLRKIRSDPRFAALLRKLNLPVDVGPATARSADAPAPPSIAVLPFADMSPKHDQEYFADGVAEEILNALSRLKGLRVIGRTSSFSFKGKGDDLRVICQKLGVNNVLEGSLRRQGRRVRVTTQLIRAADGSKAWSETYERDVADIFAVQQDVARSVAAALQIALVGNERGSAEPRSTSAEAYSLFLLGVHLSRGGLTSEKAANAIQAFRQALALDPQYGPAWAALGLVLYRQALLQGAERGAPRLEEALAAGERAIALAPDHAPGYITRGIVREGYRWDWGGARQDYERAMALDPGWALGRYGGLLASLGRAQEAIPYFERAAALDPLNAGAWNGLGSLYIDMGMLTLARQPLERALVIDPLFVLALGNRADLDLLQGRKLEALEGYLRIEPGAFRLLGLVMVYRELGREAESREALAQLTAQHGAAQPAIVAFAHAWRGEKDEALRWLERAVEQHDVVLRGLEHNRYVHSIRGDPRFQALLRKMNLPVD